MKGHHFPLGHQTQRLFSGPVFIRDTKMLVGTFLSDTFFPCSFLDTPRSSSHHFAIAFLCVLALYWSVRQGVALSLLFSGTFSLGS